MEQPLVDVVVVTYNHARYVAQALDSIFAQQTSFPIRVIVADDCSSDGTQDVLRRYREREPARLELILFERNVGLLHKDRAGHVALRRCTARYVAFLEGDDYWTSTSKLAKQVAFLEAHPECTACGHPVSFEYADARVAHWGATTDRPRRGQYTLKQLLDEEMSPMTASMMLRREVVPALPDWAGEVFMGDLTLTLLYGHHGPIGFVDEVMACNRKHGSGISSLYDLDRLRWANEALKVYQLADRHFEYRDHEILKSEIFTCWLFKAWAHRLRGEWGEAARALREYLRSDCEGPLKKLVVCAAFLLPAGLVTTVRNALRRRARAARSD